MNEIRNFIGGEFVPATGGRTLENWDPALGEIYTRLPDSDAEDVERAVIAARDAFPAWSAILTEDRVALLRRVAAGIRERLEELARAETIDSGKPLWLSQKIEIPRAAANFEFFADAITQFASECHPGRGGALHYTLRAPLGVVGCISPWNLPLYLLTWKVAPALATGNTVVAKPSEVTPATAQLLAEIFQKAGLPNGVLNIVHGTGASVGEALCSHSEVKAVSFTGSTRTGAEISRVAGPLFKKLSLEMGGKNPSIIFADADFEKALDTTIRAAFQNQGQICLCGSRIYIERPIYEKFKNALVQRAAALRIGDPLDPATEQGALVSKAHFDNVLHRIEIARQEGGDILCGGEASRVSGRCEKGWFVKPTLIEGLQLECRTNQEEIFGPVASLTPFDEEKEVLEAANGTPYGLAASVFTRDVNRAHRVAARLHAGMVWVNSWMIRDLRTPFGGVKSSGVGREGGVDALRFFTEPKNICIGGAHA